MNAMASESAQVIESYISALNGMPKTEDVLERFVDDPVLKEHIRKAEAAFPRYQIIAEQILAEGDTVALRGAFQGTHLGEFAGIAPTGKRISADIMLFYRLDGGRIVKHWMVLDMIALMQQLNN